MVKLGLPLPSANTGGAGVAAEARLSRPLGGPRLPTTHGETNVTVGCLKSNRLFESKDV